MQHIHLPQTESTQTVVKTHLSQCGSDILVSTDFQSQGVGRQGSEWAHFEDALAFSFTLTPNEVLTLTPLEIGIHLANFFSPSLVLKWPNDLINQKKEKIGGILCQLVGKTVVVGIGINLKAPSAMPDFNYPVGALFEENQDLKDNYKKELPLQILEYIKNNRLSPAEVRREFEGFCVHQKQSVVIINGNDKTEGIFEGIADNGEALIKNSKDQILKIMTGSLRF